MPSPEPAPLADATGTPADVAAETMPVSVGAAATPDAEAVAQTVAERLSEDEALRGELSDDGFTPILNWAIDLAIAAAATSADADELSGAARVLVRAIVRAAASGDTQAVRGALAPPLFTPDQINRALQALGDSRAVLQGATPDERATMLVAALAAATTGGSG